MDDLCYSFSTFRSYETDGGGLVTNNHNNSNNNNSNNNNVLDLTHYQEDAKKVVEKEPSNDNVCKLSKLAASNLKPSRKGREYAISSSIIGTKRQTILRTAKRTIYTAGRPPWYDAQGQLLEPLIIG